MRGTGSTSGRGARIALGVVIVLAALALFVFGTVLRGNHSGGLGPALLGGPEVSNAGNRFAGYQDQVVVASIGAKWQVPQVARRSRVGIASTWIGAQGAGDPRTTPFIQIGIEENMVPSSSNDDLPAPMYEAFFSDTVRGFRPDGLFPVSAGDEMTASMRLAGHRWHLSISDATSGQQRSLVTSQEGQGLFLLAEWTQEDVTDSDTNQAEPYPDLANPRLTDLTVNGAAPKPSDAESTWMALPGGYLGPTPLSGDAFSVIPVRLSTAGADYLRIIGPEDSAGARFDRQAADWRSSTSPATIRRQTDALVAVLKASDTELRHISWPASVAGLLAQVEADDRSQIAALSAAAERGGVAVQSALDRTDPSHNQTVFTLIRRGLGIQESR